MSSTRIFRDCAIGAAIMAAVAVSVHAAPLYDQNVTNAAIFGGGNANGGWTVDTNKGVEVGLRAKVRYSIPGDAPQNIFNSNGDGTYSQAAGAPATYPTRARWNFEWSVNTDPSGTSNRKISDLSYQLGIDFNPTLVKNFQIFDPINQTITDDSFGNNSTTMGNGVETANTTTYASYLMTYNLVQNSSNLDFVNEAFGQVFNPNADGVYSFYLAAFDSAGAQLARTDINVIVGNGSTVPEPASLALLGIGMVGLVAARRRKQTT